MAKIIDFNKAKKGIVLKKSALQEFRAKFSSNGNLLHLPRKRREKLNCPKCGGFVAVEGEDGDWCFKCINCSWRGFPVEICKFCNGYVVRAEGKEFCFHCLDDH